MVKAFDFAPAPTAEEQERALNLSPLPFSLPGEDYTYTATKPKDAVWQKAHTAGSARVPAHLRVAAMIDFFHGCLNDPTERAHFEDRLLAPSGADPLDLRDLLPVIDWLADEWDVEAKAWQAEHGNRADRRALARS